MMLCFLFSALIVVLDQVFKQWIVRSFVIGEEGPVIIPGVLGLTRWENDGAMLNILSGQQWLLAGIALIAAVVLILILLRYNEGFWGTLSLAAVLGGTVGNLFDRIFNDGKVIDMFRTLFVTFPIFNIADIFITLGFFIFLIHFIYITIKTEKDGVSVSGERHPRKDTLYQEDRSASGKPDDIQPIYVERATPMHNPVAPEGQVQVNEQVTSQQQVAPIQPAAPVAPAIPVTDDYSSYIDSYDTTTETTSDISLTLEALEAELGSLDVDYDVDELLREYGIEDDSNTV